MFRPAIVVLAFGISASTFAYAGVYDLTFRRAAPSSDAASCRAFAASVAAELERQSAADVLDHGCRGGVLAMDPLDAVITYQASEQLVTTSTYTFPLYSAAFYKSRADCAAALTRQETLFTAATGLAPLASYCMVEGVSQRWQTRVDGLGASAVTPDVAGIGLYGRVAEGEWERLRSDVLAAATSTGLSVFEMGVSTSGVPYHLVVRYYATEPYSLDDYDDLPFQDVASCQSAGSYLRARFAAGHGPVVVFCEDSNSSGVRMHAAAFKPTLGANTVFKARPLTAIYASHEACQAVADDLDGRAGAILAAVCAGRGGQYQIHLFARP